MKKLISISVVAASMGLMAGIRTIELNNGTTKIDEYVIPSRAAKLIGYETMMIHTNDNGTTSLDLGRVVKTTVPHTDYITTVTTTKVEAADTLVNNYYVGAIYAQQAGYDDLVHNAAFSNHYGNSTKTKYVGPDGNIFSRINLTVNGGVKTTTQPTNFYLQVTFGDTVNFNTNFIWGISEGNLTMHERSTNPALTIRLYRDTYSMKYATNDVINTTTITNTWSEGVSRTISVPLVSSMTTNGYAYSALPDPTYIFSGDKLMVDSPCATNAPGKCRIIISD